MILAASVAFAVSAALVRLLLAFNIAHLLIDHPNERSLHARPVPRTGGLGIVAGILLVLLGLVPEAWLLAAGALALAGVSVIDDWRSLSPAIRLAAHLTICAGFLLLALPGLPPPTLLLLALAAGWLTNLYNFMDGMDGLAGGMGVIGFSAYCLAAWLGGDNMIASASAAIAGSTLGFLLFNFPPARVFMGDVGSIPLGFLAAAVGALGWYRDLWSAWFPIVVFAPFIVDASVTLVRRALRGEKVWQAHRSHYYQRLVLMGWSHRRTTLFEYLLMLIGAAAALLAMRLSAPVQLSLLAILAATYIAAMIAIDQRWRTKREA